MLLACIQQCVLKQAQVAQESLSALRTVQAFNAQPMENVKFENKVRAVLSLVRKEAVASGIFFGMTGWSGNVTFLALLGYGRFSRKSLCLLDSNFDH
jgi:putative ABC transport system ATP-binding protein